MNLTANLNIPPVMEADPYSHSMTWIQPMHSYLIKQGGFKDDRGKTIC